jgi:hypothetical protein
MWTPIAPAKPTSIEFRVGTCRSMIVAFRFGMSRIKGSYAQDTPLVMRAERENLGV